MPVFCALSSLLLSVKDKSLSMSLGYAVACRLVFNLYGNSFDHIPLYSIFDKQCWQFKWLFSLLRKFWWCFVFLSPDNSLKKKKVKIILEHIHCQSKIYLWMNLLPQA